ncbi:Zn-dependent protease [Lacticaseibacillus paracasei]|nr:Zn-dependent protease [Lacticaseibacillus paracasei]
MGSTDSLHLINTKQQIVTGYVSANGYRYYQIKVGNEYYIVWGDEDIVTGDAYRDAGTTTNILSTDLISKLFPDVSKSLTRDFTSKTIEITDNENVYQTGVGEVGTTNSLNLTGTKQRVLTTYKNADGDQYYQIHVGDRYFIISSYYTKVVD